MLITTSFLACTGGLNRAPDSASTRKLKSNVKSEGSHSYALGGGNDEKLGE